MTIKNPGRPKVTAPASPAPAAPPPQPEVPPAPPETVPNLPDHPRDPMGNPLTLITEHQSTGTGQISDGAHLRDQAAEEAAADMPAVSDRGQGGYLTREQFAAAHRGVYDVVSGVTGLRSLAVQPEEVARCDAAASALYDTCLEVPALQFLIKPGNVWLQRAVAFGAFTAPHLMAVRHEIIMRRAAAAEAEAGEARPVVAEASPGPVPETASEREEREAYEETAREVEEILRPERASASGLSPDQLAMARAL